MVTHDRYMLDRISGVVLGLDGEGEAGVFADYAQWENWMEERQQTATSNQEGQQPKAAAPAEDRTREQPGKRKLSYMEAREYSTIEQRLAEAEELLQQKKAAAEDPAIASDAGRLVEAHAALDQAQKDVDELYARWAELESKIG